ncbi:MAG: hypothetical protein U5N55_08205 [Cypionkella sp.]|nr:hypothetical protein [Cypionkella sp.]
MPNLCWRVFSAAKQLGFVPQPNEPRCVYRKHKRLDQALRIVMPFPHLPAAQKLLRDEGHLPAVAAYFEAQFQTGPEPHNAAKAVRIL